VFEEYKKANVTPTSSVPKPACNADPTDFLASVIGVPEFDNSAESTIRGEMERYLSGEGGPGNLHDPLAWWKVSSFVPRQIYD
jgi:hypothetical protein